MASLRKFGLAAMTAISAAIALPLHAEEAIVKHEETPQPAAGPTIAAAETFCGDPAATVEELKKRYTGDGKLKLVDTSAEYLTYADDAKNAQVMYNFTTDKNPAHPSAVCRKIAREGEELTVKINVMCEGGEVQCAKLKSDFNVLLARMQAAVNEKVAGDKK